MMIYFLSSLIEKLRIATKKKHPFYGWSKEPESVGNSMGTNRVVVSVTNVETDNGYEVRGCYVFLK